MQAGIEATKLALPAIHQAIEAWVAAHWQAAPATAPALVKAH
jgi:hypothetical protein